MGKANAQVNGRFLDIRDGKTYKTIKIGEQVWMAENLAYKADSNCWVYDDDQKNVSRYGYLYNFEMAKKVCPSGFHLPSKEEFEILLNNYGGANDSEVNYSELIPEGNSGFDALFGGYHSGVFHNKDRSCDIWSASNYNNEEAWQLYIYSMNLKAGLNHFLKSSGYSVRCIKD